MDRYRNDFWLMIAPLLLFFSPPLLYSDEPSTATDETGIVFRVSRELISRYHIPEMQVSSPIDMCFLGSHVTGVAKTDSRLSVVMDTNEIDAVFTFQIKGITTSSTTATKGKVTVYSTGTTQFRSERAIHFDGLRFKAKPATVEATTTSILDSISVSRGPLKRAIYRGAINQANQSRPQADEQANRNVKQQVLSDFDAQTDQLISKLNHGIPYEGVITILMPKTQGWKHHLGTTKDDLILNPGPEGARIAKLPQQAQSIRAPIELWIKGKPEGEKARLLLERLLQSERALDQLRSLMKGSNDKQKNLTFTAVGDWWVLKIGEDLLEQWFGKPDPKMPLKK